MSNVIVIKLTDNWITNEQIKVGINQMLQKYGLEIEKNAIKTVFGVNSIDFIASRQKGVTEFAKERIAIEIGIQAMKEGFITYSEHHIRELGRIEIKGELEVLKIGGADNGKVY